MTFSVDAILKDESWFHPSLPEMWMGVFCGAVNMSVFEGPH